MNVSALLLELFGRIPPLVRETVDGLDRDELTHQIAPGANTIGWLVWHLTRVQDDHVAEVMDVEQVWATSDHAARFGLDADASNTGYGHSIDEMLAVRPTGAGALIAYLDAVDARTREWLGGLTDDDLDRVVDRNWDPPVTLGVRLVSVADDSLQHVGQAAYVRGLLER